MFGIAQGAAQFEAAQEKDKVQEAAEKNYAARVEAADKLLLRCTIHTRAVALSIDEVSDLVELLYAR